MIPKFSRNLTCKHSEGNTGEAVEQEGKSGDEVETVREFTQLGDRVSAGGGCEAAVTARTRCGWAKHRECDELLQRFHLMLKYAVYKSYKRQTILNESEEWCLKENKIETSQKTERSTVRTIYTPYYIRM